MKRARAGGLKPLPPSPPPHTQVTKFQYFPGDFSSIFVPTVETTRLTYFLDSLVPNKHHAMFVGNTGTGGWLGVAEGRRGAGGEAAHRPC